MNRRVVIAILALLVFGVVRMPFEVQLEKEHKAAYFSWGQPGPELAGEDRADGVSGGVERISGTGGRFSVDSRPFAVGTHGMGRDEGGFRRRDRFAAALPPLLEPGFVAYGLQCQRRGSR
ncbi:MAG: hypothetical protein WDN28_27785 [Chthoniobacter sp.]